MTPAPQCLCEQCKMTVLQCKERTSASSDKVLERFKEIFAQNYDAGLYKDQYVAFNAALDHLKAELLQQTKCEEVPVNLEHVKAKPSKER
jgi:hypothetical protein